MSDQQYYEGMREAIIYMHEELGYEDVLDTRIAGEVRTFFGDDAFDDYVTQWDPYLDNVEQ